MTTFLALARILTPVTLAFCFPRTVVEPGFPTTVVFILVDQIYSMALSPDGSIFVATDPDGLYRSLSFPLDVHYASALSPSISPLKTPPTPSPKAPPFRSHFRNPPTPPSRSTMPRAAKWLRLPVALWMQASMMCHSSVGTFRVACISIGWRAAGSPPRGRWWCFRNEARVEQAFQPVSEITLDF